MHSKGGQIVQHQAPHDRALNGVLMIGREVCVCPLTTTTPKRMPVTTKNVKYDRAASGAGKPLPLSETYRS